MAVPSLELHCEVQADRYPLLMERPGNHSSDCEHVIDVARGDATSSSGSNGAHLPDSNVSMNEVRPSSSSQFTTTAASNSRNASFVRRGDNYGRRNRSPLNSGLWISFELVVIVGQIVASIVVLSLSRDEKPQAPLFAWIVGYAAGCIATLPLLYWRYLHRNNQGAEQELTHARQASSQTNSSSDRSAYISISLPRGSEEDGRHTTATASWSGQNSGTPNSRLIVLVDHFKMALDCFFAVWFVVGNVWIFGGRSSASDAPNLYRLCIVFLTFSCIGYAMPFILCATICCCLPCIISVLGFREDMIQTRGATPESISALPTYKFKSKRTRNGEDSEISVERAEEGGILAAGTDKERIISAEDAVCCICLAKYVDNEELRELTCTHFFHTQCVDKWLKINALCPLCKSEVGEVVVPASSMNSSQRQDRAS